MSVSELTTYSDQIKELAETMSGLSGKAPYLVAVIVVVAMFLSFIVWFARLFASRMEERDERYFKHIEGLADRCHVTQEAGTEVQLETNRILGQVAETNRELSDTHREVVAALDRLAT